MSKKFTIIGVVIFTLITVGAGCVKYSNNPRPSDNSSTVEELYQEYVWKDYGITFTYPKNIFVAYDGFTMLGFSSSSNKQVDINGETLVVEGNLTIDDMIKAYKRYPKYFKSQTTEKIGEYSFVKIEYYNPIAGRFLPHYFLQINNNRVIEYISAGIGDVTTTLSSLQF